MTLSRPLRIQYPDGSHYAVNKENKGRVFFCHCVGIRERCLNAISVDKGYLLSINDIECHSFLLISK